MELVLAPIVVLLCAGGMALGLILRGRKLQSSCSGMACLPDYAHCAACPKRPLAEQDRR